MRSTAMLLAAFVSVCAMSAPDNILRNASFMKCTNPGQPDYWGTGTPERVDNWYGNYHTVPVSPVSGTQSLMLRNEEGQAGWSVQSFLYRGIEPEGDYTLTVYLRTLASNTQVTVGMGPAQKTVSVGPEWQRVVWTAKPGKSSWGYTIRFGIPKGTLYIAAPMWVKGSEPAEFALHPADQAREPVAAAPKVTRPIPTVDLPINQERTLPGFVSLYSGVPVKTQTQVRLTATEAALRIVFDCAQPSMDKMEIRGDRRDSGIYAGECVEVFIAPERTAGPYYHFAVNPNGVQSDEEGSDPAWNAKWTVQVTKRGDGWTADFAIPWSELPIGARATNTFGMNFCRHMRPGADEYGQWSCTEGSFHNPARFGLVTVPESIVKAHRGTYVPARPPAAVVSEAATPLRVLLDRSYYTTEAEARLRAWCSDPRAGAAEAAVGPALFGAKFPAGSGERMAELTIPLERLQQGPTTVEVTLIGSDGKPLEFRASDTILKLPEKPYGTKVDRFAGCFIVDGKPFVPYCMGIHSLGQIDRLQDIKDHGFNTICVGFGGSPTEEDLQRNLPRFNAFFDACRRLDLKVVWWNGRGESYEKMRDGFLRNIKAFEGEDLIIAWYILDEPEGWWESPDRKESDLPKFKEAVTQADPYRPSFFNYYAWKKGYGGYGGLVSSDVGSLDRYPIGRGPDAMKAMDDITRTMASDCLPAGKPVNIWLQLYGYDDAVREATPAEQRCQTYLCLIEGARSIMYFIYKPMGRAMWASMLPLGREIEALTPVFAAPPPQQAMTVSTDLIRFMHRQVDGRWVIVCANRSNSTVDATFQVGALGAKGPVREKFGDRVLPIQGGEFRDTFAPLATRVYVLGQ
jgi:hypothetical protein